MDALIFEGTRKVVHATARRPTPEAGEVVVKVDACGICGTDLHVYKGMPATWPVPGIRGHEIAGTVQALGEGVSRLAAGDRVVVQPLVFCGRCSACRRGETNLCSDMYLIGGEVPGGFADYVAVPAGSLFAVPDRLALEHAALVETLATPVHAFARHFHGLVRNVAILGAGAQGLLSLQLARRLGVRSILISDVVEERLAIARRLGATHVVNAATDDAVAAARAMTSGEGVDLVIDAAGLAISRQQTVAMLRSGGTGVFLALGPASAAVEFAMVVPRELHLHGTQCYTNADFTMAIELLANGEIDAEPLVRTMPLSEGPLAFEELAGQAGGRVKIVLCPQ